MKKILKRSVKFIFLFLIFFFILAAGIYVVKGYNMYKAAVEKVSPAQMAEMLRGGNYITIDELPEFYIKAVLCTEDRRFYEHGGVDIQSVARAVIHDIKTFSFEQGGSTITQQLAKNFYFTQEKHLERKFAEAFTAYAIEKEMSKDEILELYVNSIYFGSGYYGIYDAAAGYYGKEPQELTDEECAMLAGIPNAPSVYSPSENPDLARQRMEQVLECIAECETEKK